MQQNKLYIFLFNLAKNSLANIDLPHFNKCCIIISNFKGDELTFYSINKFIQDLFVNKIVYPLHQIVLLLLTNLPNCIFIPDFTALFICHRQVILITTHKNRPYFRRMCNQPEARRVIFYPSNCKECLKQAGRRY